MSNTTYPNPEHYRILIARVYQGKKNAPFFIFNHRASTSITVNPSYNCDFTLFFNIVPVFYQSSLSTKKSPLSFLKASFINMAKVVYSSKKSRRNQNKFFSLLKIPILTCIVLVTAVIFIYHSEEGLDSSNNRSFSSSVEAKDQVQQGDKTIFNGGDKDGTAVDNGKIGEDGGAWTAMTHLKQYGFNADWGLMEVLEDACRQAENTRNPPESQWYQKNYPSDPYHPLNGMWVAPKTVDCRVMEIGCGVGVYVDALKKEVKKKNRKVFGIEPNPMGGTFERGRRGPEQLAINFLNNDNTFKFGRNLREEKIGEGVAFDLIYSIEVFEHIPPERHQDAACFVAGLASPGTKLIFGAAHPGQEGVGHIGNRSGKEWIEIMSKAGFDFDKIETAAATQKMQEFNHRANTRVYKYLGDAGIECSTV